MHSAKTGFAHLHVTAVPQTHVVANSVGSRFCCSHSSPDILPTNQTIQVLILNVSASKFIEILEESLPLDLVHFFAAAICTLTGKVYHLLFSSFLVFISSVTLSLVLLELPFLRFQSSSYHNRFLPRLDSSAPGVELAMLSSVRSHGSTCAKRCTTI